MILESVEVLARLCERDAVALRGQSRLHEKAQDGQAVSTVASISARLASWCPRTEDDAAAVEESAVVQVGHGGFKSATRCRTAFLLLKACAQGGGGGAGAAIARQQLAVLASLHPGGWQPCAARRDAASSALRLFLAALASSGRGKSPAGSEADPSRAPAGVRFSSARLLPCNETAAEASGATGSEGEAIWRAAMEVWRQDGVLGEAGREQPDTLGALARVLQTAAARDVPAAAHTHTHTPSPTRAGGACDVRGAAGNAWQVGAVAELCSCLRLAAAAPADPPAPDASPPPHPLASASSTNASSSSSSPPSFRAHSHGRKYPRLARRLLAAVEACAGGLRSRTGEVALALAHFFSRNFGVYVAGGGRGAKRAGEGGRAGARAEHHLYMDDISRMMPIKISRMMPIKISHVMPMNR
jgi:hypothetical protein